MKNDEYEKEGHVYFIEMLRKVFDMLKGDGGGAGESGSSEGTSGPAKGMDATATVAELQYVGIISFDAIIITLADSCSSP